MGYKEMIINNQQILELFHLVTLATAKSSSELSDYTKTAGRDLLVSIEKQQCTKLRDIT